VIATKSWRVPAIFQLIAREGRVDREEMYQVFNMGIGMIAIVAKGNAAQVQRILRGRVIGRIENGRGATRFVW
jgi:phosphoribosylformylglycinamidine cyclo-ligase